jgi:hypothetical protein
VTKKKTVKKPQGIHRFRRGVRIPSGVDRDAALDAIVDYSHRHIPAEKVYEEVTADPTHPLYPWYEWDTDKVLREHHLMQTRQMLRSVEFVIVKQQDEEICVNVVTNVEDKNTGERVYTNTVDAMADPAYREQILQQALMELKRFQSKYRALSELAQVMDAINQVLPKNSVKAKARRARKKAS